MAKKKLISRSFLFFYCVVGIASLHVSAMELPRAHDSIIDLGRGLERSTLIDGSFLVPVGKDFVWVTVQGGVAFLPDNMGFCSNKPIRDEGIKRKIFTIQRKMRGKIDQSPIQQTKEPDTLYTYLNTVGLLNDDEALKSHFVSHPLINRHMRENLDIYGDKVQRFDMENADPKIRRFVVRAQRDFSRCGLFAVCNAIHFLSAQNESDAMHAFERDMRLDDNHEDHSVFKHIEECCIKYCENCDFSGDTNGEKVASLLAGIREEGFISDGMLMNIHVINADMIVRSKDYLGALGGVLGDMYDGQGRLRPSVSKLLSPVRGKEQQGNKRDQLMELLERIRKNLLKGLPQVLVMNSHGHWIAVRLAYVAGSENSVKVWVADSTCARDATKVEGIKRIIPLLDMEIGAWTD